jgi:hypothetical protein
MTRPCLQQQMPRRELAPTMFLACRSMRFRNRPHHESSKKPRCFAILRVVRKLLHYNDLRSGVQDFLRPANNNEGGDSFRRLVGRRTVSSSRDNGAKKIQSHPLSINARSLFRHAAIIDSMARRRRAHVEKRIDAHVQCVIDEDDVIEMNSSTCNVMRRRKNERVAW